MADPRARAVIASLRGGRNAIDPPTSPEFGATECLDAVNVDFYRAALGNKRSGMSASSTTFSSGGPFTGKVSALFRHVPSTDESAAEEWAVDDALVVGRKAGATTFAAPTLKDALTGNGWDVSFASLNGKLFIAYKSAQGRLHCWDGSTVRRTGLASSVAPTAADNGVGTWAAVTRYYRVRFLELSSGIVIRRSEATPAVTFMPAGTGSATRVTRPALPGEGETHWIIEVSVDNVSFYPQAAGGNQAVGTTTVDDSFPFGDWQLNGISTATGAFSLQKSYRFIAADQNRLLGYGSYTATDKQNRIEISAVLGSRDEGDAERVDTSVNYYVDLDENDSGDPTGLRGPIFGGNYYAFKKRQWWELAPTGTTTSPYRRTALSKTLGSVCAASHCIGEDAIGNAAIYSMTHRGLYVYGISGMKYIGKGIEDYVLGPTAKINLAATNVICHLLYHPEKRQVFAWWATGSSNDPCQAAIYDVKSGGWARIPTGDKLANLRCSMLFSNTIAASMSRDLKPYGGSALTANKLYKCDDASATDDDGTAFQAYVTTRPFEPGGPGFNGEVLDATLLAKAATGVTITATVIADFDPALTKSGTALLTATGTETRVTRRLEDSGFGQAGFIQYQLGDASAVSNGWTLDRLIIPYGKHEATGA